MNRWLGEKLGMAKPKQNNLRDALGTDAIQPESERDVSESQLQDAVLVTAENSARFSRDPSQVPSPVQSIQERLEMEFAAQASETDDSRKDLRPIGFAIAIAFSLIAWTLIIQVVRIGL